jgi:hypothetical protein
VIVAAAAIVAHTIGAVIRHRLAGDPKNLASPRIPMALGRRLPTRILSI